MATIWFGICAGETGKFERFAEPGIALVDAPTRVIVRRRQTGLGEAYNSILDEIAQRQTNEGGVGAVVLMHDDVELRDPAMARKLLDAMADPQVGVVGVIGASGVRSLRWWDWSRRGRVMESRGLLDFGRVGDPVDCVDGMFLALAPDVAALMRFDVETFPWFDGYDVDFCFQVRAAGRAVVTAPVDLVHHTKGVLEDDARFAESSRRLARKWEIRPTPADRVRLLARRVRGRMQRVMQRSDESIGR